MDPTQNPNIAPNQPAGAQPAAPSMPAAPAPSMSAANPALTATPTLTQPAAPAPSEVAATSLDATAATSPAASTASLDAAAAALTSAANDLSAAAPASPSPIGTPSLGADTSLGESGTPGVAAPVNPIIQPGGASTSLGNMDGLLSTDPIMKPEPAPAPDPVEEELKTPMKAAGLAPGSIGSASGAVNSEGKAETPPATAAAPTNPFANLFKKKQNPSVAFNDPAKEGEKETTTPAAPGAKKPGLKISKQTMIILIGLAAVLVVVLVIILVMQLNSAPSSSSSSNANNSSNNSSTPANTPTVEPVATPEIATSLSCTRKMTAEELTNYKDSLDGIVTVEATFDSSDNMITLSTSQLVEYTDKKSGEPMVVTESLIRTTPAGIDATNVDKFMLTVASDGGVDTDLKSLTTNYSNLDFTCEKL